MTWPYWPLLPEMVIVFFAFLCLALSFVVTEHKGRLALVALGGLLLATFLSIDMILPPNLSVGTAFGLWSSPVNFPFNTPTDPNQPRLQLAVTPFATLFNITFLAAGLLVALASKAFIRPEEPHQGEFYGLLLLSVVGMMFVSLATELFILYLAFELGTVTTFAMVAFRKLDTRATEAAMKFFIVGVVSSAIILFGISLLYGVSGHADADRSQPLTNLAVLRTSTAAGLASFQPTIILAVLLLIAGFGFKVATVPFHMWVPDVYTGSPSPVSAFLSTASKNMGFVAIFKIFLVAIIAVRVNWDFALGILAIATMTLGNVAAVTQRNIKRMLAYSSIGHAGYILITPVVGSVAALGIAASPGIPSSQDVALSAVTGGLYHILVYVFMKGGAFLVVGITGSLLIGEELDDYRGLARRLPVVSFAMLVFLVSLAGIPGTGGFVSKFILFSSAIQAAQLPGETWMLGLAVAGVLNSALSLYYYAKVIKAMYFLEGATEARIPVPRAYTAVVSIALLAVIITGVFPSFLIGPIADPIALAARSLFGF